MNPGAAREGGRRVGWRLLGRAARVLLAIEGFGSVAVLGVMVTFLVPIDILEYSRTRGAIPFSIAAMILTAGVVVYLARAVAQYPRQLLLDASA